jgi:hypothetical protein
MRLIYIYIIEKPLQSNSSQRQKEVFMESEKITEEHLRDEVRRLGGRSYKWVSPGCSGVPDRIVILPGGRIFFAELKSEGKISTKLQKKRQKELRELGCTVYADIDTVERVRKMLREEMMPYDVQAT